MAGVVAVDLLTWPDTSLLPLFAVGPALAAADGTRRRVVLTGAVAVVLCALTAPAHERLWSARSGVAQAAVLCVTAAAAYACSTRLRVERRLRDVQIVADTMQRLLPEPLPPPTPAADVVASYLSASDAAHVGGDLYDAVAVDGGVRLVVADVHGPVDDDSALLVLERPRRGAAMPREARRDPGPGTRGR